MKYFKTKKIRPDGYLKLIGLPIDRPKGDMTVFDL